MQILLRKMKNLCSKIHYMVINISLSPVIKQSILPGQVNWTEILNLINFYFVPLDNKIFGFNPLYTITIIKQSCTQLNDFLQKYFSN